MSQALNIQNLKKTYSNGIIALRGITLTVEYGDFFALLGPNGAGKTTLIGIVSGLVNKTSGTVFVNGISIDEDISMAKLQIGVVPQEFNFGIFEKVIDIVINQAGYYGIPRHVAFPNAERYLKQLGLWEKRDSTARTLSGGMKRRLMIARGLIHEPRFLILDEPTAGVDIELRRGMWEFLEGLNKSGITIILTTHYLEEVEQLCRNVAIINKGEIIEMGSIKKLLAEMPEESIVINLDKPIEKITLGKLSQFHAVPVDNDTIEITISKEYTLNNAVLALNNFGYTLKSLRNKANRLEEFFIKKTQKNESLRSLDFI